MCCICISLEVRPEISEVMFYFMHFETLFCRNCIGQEFALNEERVALAHILRNFEISLDETKPIKKEFLLILRPKPGLYLKLTHRDL